MVMPRRIRRDTGLWSFANTPAGSVQDLNSDYGIKSGSFVFLADGTESGCVANYVYPASKFPWTTNLETTKRRFAAKFVGCIQGSVEREEDARTRGIQTRGEFALPCTSGTYTRGQLLTMAQDVRGGAHNWLLPGEVVGTTDPAKAIARVTKDTAAAATTVYAELLPRLATIPQVPSMVHTVSFEMANTATGNILVGFTFGRKVGFLRTRHITSILQAASDDVIAFTRGGTSLNSGAADLTVLASGSALGKITNCAADLNPFLAANQFEADDILAIANTNSGTGGTGTIQIEYVDVP